MRLALGSRSIDLTTRALVVGVIDGDPAAPAGDWVRRAEDAAGAGLDVIEVPAGVVATLGTTIDVPLAVTVDNPQGWVGATEAGAALVRIVGFDPAWLTPTVLEVVAGATVVVGAAGPDGGPSSLAPADMALACEAAGLASDRVVVDLNYGPGAHALGGQEDRAGGGPVDPAVAAPMSKVAARTPAAGRVGNRPRLVSVPGRDPAAVAVAVLSGCRLIRTSDVVVARRVVDILAAIQDHRRESPT